MLASAPFGLAENVHRAKETIRERNEPAKYVDLFVVSEDSAEGIVRRVRAFPNGRLLSEKLWDDYRYTPGYHARKFDESTGLGAPQGFIRYTNDQN